MPKLPLPDKNGPAVHCDFNVWFERDVYPLAGSGSLRDLAKWGIELREGLVLTLYMHDGTAEREKDDLYVTGLVRWNEARNWWEAEVDWDTMRHESELDAMGEE